MNRNAFTMIELIFVIVILGILASVAIPKFTDTKNTAEATKEVADLRTARNEVISYVLLNQTNADLPTNNLECFSIAVDTNLTLTTTKSASSKVYCDKAVEDANKSGLLTSYQM
jgi:prepilin-type N-terminal cleavage/methylation domain-containing protein